MTPTVEHAIGEDALETALRSNAEWIWVHGEGGRPHSDALERLLETASVDPGCIVVAGLVVDGSTGRPIELLVPAGAEADTEGVLRLAQRHLLPIRNATFSHTLVCRDALVRHGLPDRRRYGPYAGIEWTARALRGEDATGIFDPSSVVVHEPPRPRPADLPAMIRTARTPTWTRGETVRQLVALVRRSPYSD
jgi:hypothetical protein